MIKFNDVIRSLSVIFFSFNESKSHKLLTKKGIYFIVNMAKLTRKKTTPKGNRYLPLYFFFPCQLINFANMPYYIRKSPEAPTNNTYKQNLCIKRNLYNHVYQPNLHIIYLFVCMYINIYI